MLIIRKEQFESMEAQDSFGGPGGLLVPAGTAGVTSNSIGHEIDLFYNYDVPVEPVKLGLQAGLAGFFPGDAVKQARGGNSDANYFLYLQANLLF